MCKQHSPSSGAGKRLKTDPALDLTFAVPTSMAPSLPGARAGRGEPRGRRPPRSEPPKRPPFQSEPRPRPSRRGEPPKRLPRRSVAGTRGPQRSEPRADLSGATLQGASLLEVKLGEADLRGVDLQVAVIFESNLLTTPYTMARRSGPRASTTETLAPAFSLGLSELPRWIAKNGCAELVVAVRSPALHRPALLAGTDVHGAVPPNQLRCGTRLASTP